MPALYVFRILSLPVSLSLHSQTKPGPNMTSAIPRNSSLRELTELQDSSMMSTKLPMGAGSSAMVVKKKWLLAAMLA